MNDCDRNGYDREGKRNSLAAALIGFAAGAVVGSIVALLYAPSSGGETREKIKDKIGDVSERATDAYADVKDRVATAYESAVEKTSSAIEMAKEKFTGKKEE